jgi:Na+/melibiose symporter-like transporter
MPLTEQQARHRVRQLRIFYSQVGWFVAINIFLLVVNLVTSPNDLWFYWVTIFWGLALLLQAFTVFFTKGSLFGKDWEERKVAKLTGRDK